MTWEPTVFTAITRPDRASLTDLHREYRRAHRAVQTAAPEAVQIAVLYRSQVRTWRQARLTTLTAR